MVGCGKVQHVHIRQGSSRAVRAAPLTDRKKANGDEDASSLLSGLDWARETAEKIANVT